MAYASWSVVFGEQPSAAKWNILGTNDASFNDGTGIGAGVIGNSQLATGVPVQVVSVSYSAVATGTTIIPFDDTIPQNTEGDEYMSLAITPKSTSNILVIEVAFFGSISIGNDLILALFQDSTVNAIAATSQYNVTATARNSIKLIHRMAAGTTSSTTFKLRAGPAAAGTTTFNGNSSARLFGAIPKSSIVITEYKA